MPIEFSCECGKGFKVADEFAGKRTKCTACGKPVVVPTPAAVEESAEDAALRALTEGDGPEPAPRAASSYASRPEPAPPRPVSPSAVARPQASTARKDPPPTYRSTTAPAKSQSSPNWAKVIGGVVMAALGVVIGVGAVALLLSGGRVSVWLLIVPVLFILASPFFVIDGFRDRVKK